MREHASQHTTPVLARDALLSLLDSGEITKTHALVLRWLIWLPLLSVKELTRVMERDHATIASHLERMEKLHVLEHMVLDEPGALRHYRYHVSDCGLYTFAAQFTPPLAVPRLAEAYAVEREDLIAHLARPAVHLTLADFATRLIAEGRQLHYTLQSWQQPWRQRFTTLAGTQHTLNLDAALLIEHPAGTQHALYVVADVAGDHFRKKRREQGMLTRLIDLRQVTLLRKGIHPHLLIITTIERIPFWGQLLQKVSQLRGCALLDGGITTTGRIQEGVYTPIWWSFDELARWSASAIPADVLSPCTSLDHLLGSPASSELIEQFSQRASFHHLLIEEDTLRVRTLRKTLPLYVRGSLMIDAAALDAQDLKARLNNGKAEQLEATALLSLALSSHQKQILEELTYHPLLSMPDLLALLQPGTDDLRMVQRHMTGLFRYDLLLPFEWHAGHTVTEKERWLLPEHVLRYVAIRAGFPASYYLVPEAEKKNDGPLWIQQGAAGLFAQMAHTNALYRCLRLLLKMAHREQTPLLLWKNTREATRVYYDGVSQDALQIRPDAELVYIPSPQAAPRSILLEYDRATTGEVEYEGKFLAYAEYQRQMHTTLPPVLVVTQHIQAAQAIRQIATSVAERVCVLIVLEAHLLHQGLVKVLAEFN